MMYNLAEKKILSFGLHLPDKEWLEMVRDYQQCTPDIAELNRFEHQFLFVYDEMMKRNLKNELLKDCEYKCEAFTEPKFLMYRKKLGMETFPIPFKTEAHNQLPSWADPNVGSSAGRANPARIKGELYKLRPSQFIPIDRYKCNTIYFYRKRVRLTIPNRREIWLKDPKLWGLLFACDIPTANSAMLYSELHLDAWMHIAKKDFWEGQIDAGFQFDPVRIYPHRKGAYYSFTKRELDVEDSIK